MLERKAQAQKALEAVEDEEKQHVHGGRGRERRRVVGLNAQTPKL